MQKHDTNTNAGWKKNKERSNSFMLQLLVWLAILCGRTLIKPLVCVIATYFLIFAPASRQASIDYLSRVFKRKARWRECWKHFYCFAQSSVDRFYLLSNKTHIFNIKFFGKEVIENIRQSKTGAILITSHFGSFEIMRVLGHKEESLPLRILMDKQLNSQAMKIIDNFDPELAACIIDVQQPTANLALTLNQSIKNGELVGIMADRCTPKEATHTIPFLGSTADFPLSPWRLAMSLKVPVYLCTGIYQGGNTYHLHFESLASSTKVPRKERHQAVIDNMTLYVKRLEKHILTSPYNWFNFYKFWHNETH